MTDPLVLLQAALTDRYTIERELGRGGMATVYLAQDLKHHRPVALKVLHPQIAAVLGSDRFLREIETAANLNHPHILPLFDSGAAGPPGSGTELLWYAMPVVEGESLRDLLNRERQVSMDRARGIARDVAGALAHAHAHGIVHRDIKPENILLAGEHALVADFGIAKALNAAGGEKLTETGLAIGTAAYMSPEQASGERDLDGRSDIYALGCVLYEMLAGHPPFAGPTAQSVLARHALDPVPSLHTVRQEIPAAVDRAVHRALAKVPSDRFATATQFADALSYPGETVALESVPPSRARAARFVAGLAVFAAIMIAFLVWSRRSPAPPLDSGLIAVFPFRVSGTEQSFGVLRDGMVDFLEAKFSGAGGARVVPARTALAAWDRAVDPQREELTEEEARGVARRLGAGALVLGTIVATPGNLVVHGSLVDTEAGGVRAEAKVEGVPDSLHSLIDRFAAQLVALGAGEQANRLASLTSTSLPALYAYLAGKAAHRAGQYDSALQHFDRALEHDSTFARAALGYRGAAGWAGNYYEPRTLRLAWTYRDRLSPRDQVLLIALAGPNYPRVASPHERIAAWEEAARQVPDDPDIWNYLGDGYFHDGALADMEAPFRRASEAFNRALALDTTLNVEPMIHLLQIAGVQRDTATVRRLLTRFPENAPLWANRRLGAALVLGDSTMLAAARPAFDSTGDIIRFVDEAQSLGYGIQEAERVVPLMLKRLGTQEAQSERYTVFLFFLNLGRPAAAAATLDHIGQSSDIPVWASQLIINHAVLGDGDTTAAAEAVARLAPSADGPPARNPAAREAQYLDICSVALWRLVHYGNTRAARAGLARLAGGEAFRCDVLLEALLAAAEGTADAGAALERLEALLLAGGGRWSYTFYLARLREAQGDIAGALRAIRRRPGYSGLILKSYALREEGRLAALTGDREGAIEAYSHYLTLRYNPEPPVQPEVDRARAELARLVGESRP